MRAGPYLRTLVRETRGAGGRLAFFVLCLAVGVAAVVAVAGLAAGVEGGIRTEARQLLAADLAVAGRQPAPEEVRRLLAARPGVAVAETKEMVTMAAAAGEGGVGRSQLVELKAVGPGYPFYGRLELEPASARREGAMSEAIGAGTESGASREGGGGRPSEGGEEQGAVLDARSVAVAPDLLARLGLAIGDALALGGEEFRIAAVVEAEPDRIGGAFTLGPRVLVSLAGLERTDLERFGSRIDYRLLVRLPPGSGGTEAEALEGEILAALPEGGRWRVESFSDAQPALRDGIGRVERFLGLVALLSLLVGGVGVAQTVRAWLDSRLDAIAVLRCLGVRPREVIALYAGHAVLLGLVGSALGALAGVGLIWLVPRLLADLLPAAPPSLWQPAALARGAALGLGVALVFSLPPLLATRRVSPARVLRRDAEPLPPDRRVQGAAALLLAGAVWATAAVQSGSALLGLGFTAGVAAATAFLALTAAGVVRLVRRLPRGGGLALRYGLAALARPGAATAGAMVALGIGVLVVLAMALVQAQLAAELGAQLPEEAPTVFLVDVQHDQWPGVRAVLEEEGATHVDSAPVVTARLAAIDGRSVEAIAEERGDDGEARWALTREQRLTWRAAPAQGNEIVAGALWSDPERGEVSVEEEFAGDLGIGLGAELTFDVQGVPVEMAVTSLRRVDWQTFRINFFLVAEPGVLDAAPGYRVAAARLPEGGEQHVQDRLAAGFPNVTLLRVREILDKVAAALDRLAVGVRFLGGFTVLTGIVILGGAVSAGAVRRAREVALLKTLGVTRRGVTAIYATEYALVGLLAGVIGAAGGTVLAWAVVTRGMELGWELRPALVAAGVAGSALLTVLAGVAASWGALRRRPVEVLRRG